MKRLTLLLLLSSAVAFAEEVTLTKSAIFKADRTIVSLKPGTVVEVVSRDDNSLTIHYGKLTGKIPLASIAGTAAPVEVARPAPDTVKKVDPVPTPAPGTARQATTNYDKAVEKAKENAGKHDKNLVKPADAILQ